MVDRIFTRIRLEPAFVAGVLSAAADALNEGLGWRQAAIVAVSLVVRHFVTPA